MFRSHRHSIGRTHTVTLGILAAALLSTPVEAAAPPDPFFQMAPGDRSAASGLSAADSAAAPQRLRRRPRDVRPDPAAGATERCLTEAMTRRLIARAPGCDAAEELAPRTDFVRPNLAATQGHRDVPHPQGDHPRARGD